MCILVVYVYRLKVVSYFDFECFVNVSDWFPNKNNLDGGAGLETNARPFFF